MLPKAERESLRRSIIRRFRTMMRVVTGWGPPCQQCHVPTTSTDRGMGCCTICGCALHFKTRKAQRRALEAMFQGGTHGDK